MAKKSLRKGSKHKKHHHNKKHNHRTRRNKHGGMLCKLNKLHQSGGAKVPMMPASVKSYLDKPTWTAIGPQGEGNGTRLAYNNNVVPLPAPENTELPFSQCGGSKKKTKKNHKINKHLTRRNKKNKKNKKSKNSRHKHYRQKGGGMFPDINNFARVVGNDLSNIGTAWRGEPPYPSPLPWKQPSNAKTTILTPAAPNIPRIQKNADSAVAAMKPPSGSGASGADAADASGADASGAAGADAAGASGADAAGAAGASA